MSLKTHWEHIYQTKSPTQVSWYQEHSLLSLQLIIQTRIAKTGKIIDVGGGPSALVGDLLNNDYQSITVLDISAASLEAARERLGTRANEVTWLEADILQTTLPHYEYDLWHDRAVFHFLTELEDRRRYVNAVKEALKPGGHVIVATFASDGPERCSGLPVVRYEPESLHNEFGDGFTLLDSTHETHQTPFGTEQKFIYCYCRKY
ncbi:MAG TPA: class I SAM-dependent methyltransferase [Anaerolineales bacterium]|nr:class I SAM-dependent methyltransferase [Anaerolineales bacterium]